jgi:hypothetical protein
MGGASLLGRFRGMIAWGIDCVKGTSGVVQRDPSLKAGASKNWSAIPQMIISKTKFRAGSNPRLEPKLRVSTRRISAKVAHAAPFKVR